MNLLLAVVLILRHTHEGSYGIAINKPLNMTLPSVVINLPGPAPTAFKDNKIFHGGKIQRLNMLHELPEAGGEELPMSLEPIYAGGDIEEAAAMVEKDLSLSEKVHFYVGCYTWYSNEYIDYCFPHDLGFLIASMKR